MVFEPEFYQRLLDVVPWWCWVLEAALLLAVVGVPGLRDAARRRAPAEARPEIGPVEQRGRS